MPQNYPTPEELEKIRREKEEAENKDTLVNSLKKAAKDFQSWAQPSYFSGAAQESIDNVREGKTGKKRKK